MVTNNGRLSRKNALRIVGTAAVLLLALILIRSLAGSRLKLSDPEGRVQYLADLGWEVDPATEERKTVLIPQELEGVMSDYNALQLDQGFDLAKHLGESCEQYTYTVTNYAESTKPVYVTLYIQGNRVIAGDIHSNALDGFMRGLYDNEPSDNA